MIEYTIAAEHFLTAAAILIVVAAVLFGLNRKFAGIVFMLTGLLAFVYGYVFDYSITISTFLGT